METKDTTYFFVKTFDLVEKHFRPLIDADVKAINKKAADKLDRKIDDLNIPAKMKKKAFDMCCMTFFNRLLNGDYELDKEENFHRDAKGNRVIKMNRQKALRELGLMFFAHYFADKLGSGKEIITAYLVGFWDYAGYVFPVKHITSIAETDDPVLITGETGTGKELLARAIHYLSHRKKEAFIPINCGGINEETLHSELFGHVKGAFTGAFKDKTGLFEEADSGTIFLDEIGDMPQKVQVSLLRTLNDGKILKLGDTYENFKKIDVRIIAATNKDLPMEIEAGRFREDLYYRLCIHSARLPSFKELPPMDRLDKLRMIFESVLREQSARDISLAQAGAEIYAPIYDANTGEVGSPSYDPNLKHLPISKEAIDILMNHDFPGNYRQLTSVIKNAWVKTKRRIEVEHLSKELLGTGKEDRSDSSAAWLSLSYTEFKNTVEAVEKEMINRLLSNSNGMLTKAAKAMGIPRHQLARRMNKLGITAKKK